jgi:hypothetical protein
MYTLLLFAIASEGTTACENKINIHTYIHKHIQVKPNEAASPNGLSTLARFAIAPHTLPASVLNALKVSILGGEQLVPSNTYLLAQANNETWPAYSFRVHIRPLPEKCIHAIIAEVKSKPPPGVPGTHGLERLKCMFPVTNRGISADIARHNLNILCHLDSADTRNSSHLGLTVFSWFLAAGFKQPNLVDMCASEPAKANVRKFVTQVKTAAANKTSFYQVLVYTPLPVNTDVRYVTSSDKVQLFLCHEESAGTTIQWMFSLLLFYGLRKDSAPQEFRKYTEESRAGRETDPDTPARILKGMIKRITQVIVKGLKNCSTEKSATESLEKVVPIAELLAQLCVGEKSGMALSKYSEAVLDGLTDGLCGSQPALQKSLSDALYMLVGITPENLGEEMMCMVKFWREKSLLISSNVLSEISFMANNVYNTSLVSLSEKLRRTLASPPSQEKYVRKTSNNPLVGFLATELTGKSCSDVYAEVLQAQDMLLCIPRSHQNQKNENANVAVGSTVSVANAGTSEVRRRSDYDHDTSDAVFDEVHDEEYVLFRKPRGDDISGMAGRMNVSEALVNVSRGLYDATPQTVSARHLMSLDCYPWYGVLRVVPGRHLPLMYACACMDVRVRRISCALIVIR